MVSRTRNVKKVGNYFNFASGAASAHRLPNSLEISPTLKLGLASFTRGRVSCENQKKADLKEEYSHLILKLTSHTFLLFLTLLFWGHLGPLLSYFSSLFFPFPLLASSCKPPFLFGGAYDQSLPSITNKHELMDSSKPYGISDSCSGLSLSNCVRSAKESRIKTSLYKSSFLIDGHRLPPFWASFRKLTEANLFITKRITMLLWVLLTILLMYFDIVIVITTF